jgi:hypothetical protein
VASSLCCSSVPAICTSAVATVLNLRLNIVVVAVSPRGPCTTSLPRTRPTSSSAPGLPLLGHGLGASHAHHRRLPLRLRSVVLALVRFSSTLELLQHRPSGLDSRCTHDRAIAFTCQCHGSDACMSSPMLRPRSCSARSKKSRVSANG